MDRRTVRRHILVALATVAGAIIVVEGSVVLLTHVVAPLLLTHDEHNPALEAVPKRTRTRRGLEGDPVNVAFVGTAEEVATAFAKAGWSRADSLSRASDFAIAKSVVLHRPDSAAPVSSLFLYGRRQDVAYEREVGRSASRRHHVRLWLATGVTGEGRPVWIGDAAYDLRAGVSHRAPVPTHHIEADVDRERDTVFADLAAAGQLSERYDVTGLGPRIDARNAEGDRFDTDGDLDVGVISPGNVTHGAPTAMSDPPLVQLKNTLFEWSHQITLHLRP
jgi:LssY C-terminus